MGKFLALLGAFVLFFAGCEGGQNIEPIDTTAPLSVKLTKIASENGNLPQAAFDNGDEITINGESFVGKYAFQGADSIILLPKEPLEADKNYKITLDFEAINKTADTSIAEKSHTINVRTKPLLLEVEGVNFTKTPSGNFALEAILDLSQEIPLEAAKKAIKLLDSANKPIDFALSYETGESKKSLRLESGGFAKPRENLWLIIAKNIGISDEKKIEITPPKGDSLEVLSINASESSLISVRFSEELGENSHLSAFVRISPEIDFSASQERDTIHIKAPFVRDSRYKITLLGGIKSHSSALKDSVEKEVSFSDIEPKIAFSNEGVFLPSSAKKRLAFKSVNVKKARLVVQKIYANNIAAFLAHNNLTKNDTNAYYYGFENIGDTIFTQDLEIKHKKNAWVQSEIDLGNLKDSSGIFIVSLIFDKNGVDYAFPSNLAEWKKEDFFYTNGRISRQLIFSNIALIAHKVGKNIIATTLDLATNAPLEGATITALSQNNQVISSAKSDKNGDVRLDSTAKRNEATLEAKYLIAQKNDAASIIKLSAQEVPNDGFDVGGIAAQNGTKAFIFTERSVYRPGESVNLGIIARNDGKPLQHPITLSIKNPRGKNELDAHTISPLEDGVYHYEFKTAKSATTGQYKAVVNIGGAEFTHKIAVETIVPSRIKAAINAKDALNLEADTRLDFSLQGDYLFGAPASGLRYELNADIRAHTFASKKYKDWVFENPSNLKTTRSKQVSGVLNEQGFAQNAISLENLATMNRNLRANLALKVFENNGRANLVHKTVLLRRFDSTVGIKPPQDRDIKQGQKVSVPVILLDENDRPIPKRRLIYKIYNNNYSWWWDYGDYERFIGAIKSDKNTRLIQEGEILSQDFPANIVFEAHERGEIMLEVIDSTNNQSAAITLYASSWGEPSAINKPTQLSLKSNKDAYKSGDEAKITFESTKNAKALVVVSRESELLERFWLETAAAQTTFALKIKEKWLPNVYVSVFLLQDYATANNDRALRLYGTLPLKITSEKHKITPIITAKSEIRPNSTLEVEISNKENREATYALALVDEGLLEGFKTPSPYDYFYAKTRLDVAHYDNLDYFIGRNLDEVARSYAVGGDSEMAAFGDKQGKENAERFKLVSSFIKPFKSDKNGRAKQTFKIPAYIGSLRLMAVAVEGDSYGSAEKNVIVSAPVVAFATLPRSLKVGDSFKMPVEILPLGDKNGESSAKSVQISVKTSGLVEFSEPKRSLEIKNKAKTLFFEGKTKRALGVENIDISLVSGDFSMQDSTQIDIKAPNPHTILHKNYALEAKKPLEIQAPKAQIDNAAKGILRLSATPQLSVSHRLLWLMRYPFGCLEQIVSTAFPLLFIDSFSNDFIDKQAAINHINAAIEKIAKFQTKSGGFALWQGGEKTNRYVSSYAGHFLLLAKKNGYFVNESLLKRWLDYEAKAANNAANAYALYLLALSNNAALGAMNEIYENHLSGLSNTDRWLLGAAYKAAGFDDIAAKITQNLAAEPNENAEYYESSFGSPLRNKAMIFMAHRAIYKKPQDSLYEELKNAIESDAYLATQSLAYALVALADAQNRGSDAQLSGTITINGKNMPLKGREMSFDLSKGAATIKPNEAMFANYTWEGISANNEADNIARNMRLSREFVRFDEQGNELKIKPQTLKSGESFYLKLTLEALNDITSIKGMSLAQKLPSGWEIEIVDSESLPKAAQNALAGIEHSDFRDDYAAWFFDLYKQKIVYVKINTVTPGDFTLPPAYAEAMYDDSYQASSEGAKVSVLAR